MASRSEADFLMENLLHDAPPAEVKALLAAWQSPLPNVFSATDTWDTTMTGPEFADTMVSAQLSDRDYGSHDWQEFKFLQRATPAEIEARIYSLILTQQNENGATTLPSLEYPAPHLVLSEKVEAFARSHMFNVNKHVKPTTLQRREYTRDIYDYARALGMGRRVAAVEVLRARARYRVERGVEETMRLDESDDESALEMEISDAVEYITSVQKGMVQGPIDPAGAWSEISRLEAKCRSSTAPTKKRKRGKEEIPPKKENKVAGEVEKDVSQDRIDYLERKKRRKLLKKINKHTTPTPVGSAPVDRAPAESASAESALAQNPPAESGAAESAPDSEPKKKPRKRRKRKQTEKSDEEGNAAPSEDLLLELKPAKEVLETEPGLALSDMTGAESGQSHALPPDVEEKTNRKPQRKATGVAAEEANIIKEPEFIDLRQKKKKKRSRRKVVTTTTNGVTKTSDVVLNAVNTNMITTPLDDFSKPKSGVGHELEDNTDTSHQEESEGENSKKNDTGEPLAELSSTRENTAKGGRRNRLRMKKIASMDATVAQPTASDAVKDHHS